MYIFWDLVLILLLVTPFLFSLLLMRDLFYFSQKNQRLHAVKYLFLAGCMVWFCVIAWGGFIEPELIVIKKTSYNLGLKEPITFAVFSDVQTNPYRNEIFVQRIVEKVLTLQPDAILYPGDFVQNEINGAKDALLWYPVTALTGHVPFIGVMGNHEHGYGNPTLDARTADMHEEVRPILESYGIRIIDNGEYLFKNKNGQRLRVVGLDDLWASHFEIPEVKKESIPTIAIAHNPDSIYGLDGDVIQLVLAAHTHGGQIRLPVIGPLSDAGTRLPRALYKGASVVNNIPLYVTSGMGESGPRARLFNPPEIVLVTIK